MEEVYYHFVECRWPRKLLLRFHIFLDCCSSGLQDFWDFLVFGLCDLCCLCFLWSVGKFGCLDFSTFGFWGSRWFGDSWFSEFSDFLIFRVCDVVDRSTPGCFDFLGFLGLSVSRFGGFSGAADFRISGCLRFFVFWFLDFWICGMLDAGSLRRSDFSEVSVTTFGYHRIWCVAMGSDGVRQGSVPIYLPQWAARRIQKSTTEDLLLKIVDDLLLKIFGLHYVTFLLLYLEPPNYRVRKKTTQHKK